MLRQCSFWTLILPFFKQCGIRVLLKFRIWRNPDPAKREWVYELGPGGVPGVGYDVPLLLTQCRAGHQAGGGGASLQPTACLEYLIRIRIQTLISDDQKYKKGWKQFNLFSFNISFYFFGALVEEIHSSRKNSSPSQRASSSTKHEIINIFFFLGDQFWSSYGSECITS